MMARPITTPRTRRRRRRPTPARRTLRATRRMHRRSTPPAPIRAMGGRTPRPTRPPTPARDSLLEREDGDALDLHERARLEQAGDLHEAHRGIVRTHAGAPAFADRPL